MKKHVTSDGSIRDCTANKKACPYGSAFHADSQEEAEKIADNLNKHRKSRARAVIDTAVNRHRAYGFGDKLLDDAKNLYGLDLDKVNRENPNLGSVLEYEVVIESIMRKKSKKERDAHLTAWRKTKHKYREAQRRSNQKLEMALAFSRIFANNPNDGTLVGSKSADYTKTTETRSVFSQSMYIKVKREHVDKLKNLPYKTKVFIPKNYKRDESDYVDVRLSDHYQSKKAINSHGAVESRIIDPNIVKPKERFSYEKNAKRWNELARNYGLTPADLHPVDDTNKKEFLIANEKTRACLRLIENWKLLQAYENVLDRMSREVKPRGRKRLY